METTKLSSKGQVVLPKLVRDARSWEPGAESAVEEVPKGILLRPLRPFAALPIHKLRRGIRLPKVYPAGKDSPSDGEGHCPGGEGAA
jgi:AbrB family looped-hinge helix DNA binding protein